MLITEGFIKWILLLNSNLKLKTKQLIISTFQELLYHKLIRTNIALPVLGNKRENKPRLQKTLRIELKQLTSLLISKATTLYYFEII